METIENQGGINKVFYASSCDIEIINSEHENERSDLYIFYYRRGNVFYFKNSKNEKFLFTPADGMTEIVRKSFVKNKTKISLNA